MNANKVHNENKKTWRNWLIKKLLTSESTKEDILQIIADKNVNDSGINNQNYEKNLRAVTTASFEQVRSKIQKDTSKQWERFSDYLEPMQETLKTNQIKF